MKSVLSICTTSARILLKRNFSMNSTQNEQIIKAAVLQLKVNKELTENLKRAEIRIREAKKNGAELILLPECFNTPCAPEYFQKYGERLLEGPTSKMLSKAASDNAVYLVGGTIPVIEDSKLYNTCTVWNPKGTLIAKFRKMHLFDIDIPQAITVKESDIMTAGSELVTFSINGVKIGLGICYDLRFEEFAKLYRLQDCQILIFPAAFNTTTGPLHFEVLQRARAIDNQVFVLTVSSARGDKGYIAWGHSQITSPWGKVLAQAGANEEVLYCDLDLNLCKETREQIPIFDQRRCDIYNLALKDN